MAASMTDYELAKAAGFSVVKSGKTTKYKATPALFEPKACIKKALRVLDEQNAVNRFKWHGLPSGLTGSLLERMIYYRGQLCFFLMEDNLAFYCLPYSGVGGWDVYGRPQEALPLIFKGPNQVQGDEKEAKDKAFITGFTKRILYDFSNNPDKDMRECAVILKDYTPQLPDRIIPRYELMDATIDLMSECFPLARTQLIANSGVKGMRVDSQDSKDEVVQASNAIYQAALRGLPYVPILGLTEFQEFTSSALKVEDYLIDMQALDNFRLSLHGLSSGGLFQKKAHMLEGEEEMNEKRAVSTLEDCLAQRERFCDLVNDLWGLGISVELDPSAQNGQETALGGEIGRGGLYSPDQGEKTPQNEERGV